MKANGQNVLGCGAVYMLYKVVLTFESETKALRVVNSSTKRSVVWVVLTFKSMDKALNCDNLYENVYTWLWKMVLTFYEAGERRTHLQNLFFHFSLCPLDLPVNRSPFSSIFLGSCLRDIAVHWTP